MNYQSFQNIQRISFGRSIIFFIVISALFSFISCKKKEKEDLEGKYNPNIIPSMISFNDTVVYSDSGRVKLIVEAEKILIFDKAKEPYTMFPDKAYMEQYDTLMIVITKLWADTIWNYNKKKLWKFKGNVRIEKGDGKIYESNELYWDESKDKIYSNEHVMIHEPNKATIRAKKFESNQNMTNRTFFGAKDGELYISDKVENEKSE